MNPTWLNTEIGIVAGSVTILTGIVALVRTLKPPPIKPLPQVRPVKPVTPFASKVKGVQEFVGDDPGYQNWVINHPNGFVVNTYQYSNPRHSEYVALHRAKCGLVSNFQARQAGAFTGGDFMKACASDVESLRQWVKARGRVDGSFTSEKCNCKPL